MPTRPKDVKLRRGATGPFQSSSKTKVPKRQSQKPPLSSSPSVGVQDQEYAARRKKKSPARRLLSLSTIAYLGYSFLYACGSPFDDAADKPVICQAIDPLKLDIYAAYQSDFYKRNLDPYISPVVIRTNELYHTYGIPAQIELVKFYQLHGKTTVDNGFLQAKQVYNTKIVPVATPYLITAKGRYYFVEYKLRPYLNQASVKTHEVKAFIKYQWDHLPPPVMEAKDTILYWAYRAENTELIPLLVEYYRILVDFCEHQVVPTSKHAVQLAKQQYDTHLKMYVDEHVKPLLIKCNDHVHLDLLLERARALVAQMEPPKTLSRDETVASTIAETKTPTTTPNTLEDIPITGTITKTKVAPHKETHIGIVDKVKEAASAIGHKVKEAKESAAEGAIADKVKETVSSVGDMVDKVKEAAAAGTVIDKAENAVTSAIDKVEGTKIVNIIVDKVEDTIRAIKANEGEAFESVDKVKEATIDTYSSYVTSSILTEGKPTTASTTASAKVTVGSNADNKDNDIVYKPATASVTPLTTPEFEDVPIPPPDANKKEAIYCPTCKAEEEQIIVAPTDKHVVAIPEEHKEVFEVNKEQIVFAAPPQSPNNAGYLKKDVQAIPDEKELFEVHKEPIIATPESHVKKEEEKEMNINVDDEKHMEEQIVLETVVEKKSTKIPTSTKEDNVESQLQKDMSPDDESQFSHDQHKDRVVLPVPQEAFTVVEKKEQPTVAVMTEEDPIVPNDESGFVVEKEDISVDGVNAEEKYVHKKMKDETSM